MIFSIDGNVYSGKTSILNRLSKEENIKNINEYSPIETKNTINSNNALCVQMEYLNQESIRKHIIEENCNKHQLEFISLDRSFYSISAHVLALYKIKNIDIRTAFLSLLKEKFEKEEIITPEITFVTKTSWETIIRRYVDGETTNKAKGTPLELVHPKYYEIINYFYIELSNYLGQQSIVIVDSSDINDCLNNIKSYINNLKPDPVSSTQVLSALNKIYIGGK